MARAEDIADRFNDAVQIFTDLLLAHAIGLGGIALVNHRWVAQIANLLK
jgi:hypothetical protein